MHTRAEGQAQHSREGNNPPRRDREGIHDEYRGSTNKADLGDKSTLFADSNDDTTAPEGTNIEEGAEITAVPATETDEERRSAMVVIYQPPNEHSIEPGPQEGGLINHDGLRWS